MVDYLVLPDLEAVSSVSIRNAGIPGLIGVYSSIPTKPRYPLATVKRLGGFPIQRQRLDMARIQIDVWGGSPNDGPNSVVSKSDIHDIAQLARVALFRMEGQHFTTPVDAYVTAVRDSLGVTWSPDSTANRDRYLFAVNVYGSSPPSS